MTLDASEMAWAPRLSGQLHSLSQLVESLTFRVLELEERLAVQERDLASLRQESDQQRTSIDQAMEERLGETEERLGRIDALLAKEGQRTLPSPSLRALHNPSALGKRDRRPRNGVPEQTQWLDPPHGETSFEDDHPCAPDRPEQSLAS